MAPIMLRAVQVERTYGHGPQTVTALCGVSLAVPGESLIALMGRSGSGKTTLLNLLGGLDRPTRGRVYLGDTELSGLPEPLLTVTRRTNIGYMFQSGALHPLLSAAENIQLALSVVGVPLKEHQERVEQWLGYMGLQDRMHHRPMELSGGEQQRVALARALAVHPKVILADEPTGQLDSRTAHRILALLQRITRETRVAICMTSHDPIVREYVDELYILRDGQITPEEVS